MGNFGWCVKEMTERDYGSDPEKSEKYAQTMKNSRSELEALRMDLQNLMMKFGLRALKLYQTGANEPLQPQQMSYLIKYELTNAIQDLSAETSIEAIIKQTKAEWQKQQQK
jgi:hypothetical protein